VRGSWRGRRGGGRSGMVCRVPGDLYKRGRDVGERRCLGCGGCLPPYV